MSARYLLALTGPEASTWTGFEPAPWNPGFYLRRIPRRRDALALAQVASQRGNRCQVFADRGGTLGRMVCEYANGTILREAPE